MRRGTRARRVLPFATMSAPLGNPVKNDDIFSFDDADIALRSSDGTVFAVHRCILRWIAPFFADMLSLPQPENPSPVTPVIDMSEDSASLRLLLRFSYPRTLHVAPALTEVRDITANQKTIGHRARGSV